MKAKIKCCLGCTDRHPACWGSCEKYKAEKAAVEAEKKPADPYFQFAKDQDLRISKRRRDHK